jgi:rod shape-determining protein MreC
MRDNKGGPLIRIFLVIAAVAALSVFTPVRDLPPVNAARALVFRIVYPVQFVSFKVFSSVRYAGSSLISLRNAQKENERLKRELATQTAVTNLFTELAGENRRLRALAGFRNKNIYGFHLIPGEVIARSPSSWFNSLIVDRGSEDGVREGKAVISESGLVGRVAEVYPHSCKVLLIIDENSSVSVLLPRISEIGVVAGRGPKAPQLKYISSTSEIRDGDIAVTSGISDYFPRGIPVGRVREAEKKDFDLFHNISIKTEVDLFGLQSVFIVR